MHAGYELPLSFAGGLGAHRLVESMKHAFALRQGLGDPGICPGAATCFLNLTDMLDDMLSPAFAASLRSSPAPGLPGSTDLHIFPTRHSTPSPNAGQGISMLPVWIHAPMLLPLHAPAPCHGMTHRCFSAWPDLLPCC